MVIEKTISSAKHQDNALSLRMIIVALDWSIEYKNYSDKIQREILH